MIWLHVLSRLLSFKIFALTGILYVLCSIGETWQLLILFIHTFFSALLLLFVSVIFPSLNFISSRHTCYRHRRRCRPKNKRGSRACVN